MKSSALLCVLLIGSVYGQCVIEKCSDAVPCRDGTKCISVDDDDFNYCQLSLSDVLQLRDCPWDDIRSVVTNEMDALVKLGLRNRGFGDLFDMSLVNRISDMILPKGKEFVESLDIAGRLKSSENLRNRLSELVKQYLKDGSGNFMDLQKKFIAVLDEELNLKDRLQDMIDAKREIVEQLMESVMSLAQSISDPEIYSALVANLDVSDQVKAVLADSRELVQKNLDIALKGFSDQRERLLEMIREGSVDNILEMVSNMPDFLDIIREYISDSIISKLREEMNLGDAKKILSDFLSRKGEEVGLVLQRWITGGQQLISLDNYEMVQVVMKALMDNRGLLGTLLKKDLAFKKELLGKAVEWMKENGEKILDVVMSQKEKVTDFVKDKIGSENPIDYLKRQSIVAHDKMKDAVAAVDFDLVRDAVGGSSLARVALAKQFLISLLNNDDAMSVMATIARRYPDEMINAITAITKRMELLNIGGSAGVRLRSALTLLLREQAAMTALIQKLSDDPFFRGMIVRILEGGKVDVDALRRSLRDVLRLMDMRTRIELLKSIVPSTMTVQKTTTTTTTVKPALGLINRLWG